MTAPTDLARTPPGETPILRGMAALADRYDGFILDLWGTIHDGVAPLPGAIDCLERLCAAGKRLLILSNAPRRAHSVVERMDGIGVPRDLYHAVLSSGEAAHIALRDRPDAWHASLGRNCFLIGMSDDDSVLEDLDYGRVREPDAADFILNVGAFNRADTVADYEALLATALQRDLPMVCCNPDLVVLRGDVRELCAGAIAQRYEESGGNVFWHGKPHGAIYDMSFELLGLDGRHHILTVGDSMRTDIAGSAVAGLDSVFIAGGIHAEALGMALSGEPEPAQLAALYAESGHRPTVAMPTFRW